MCYGCAFFDVIASNFTRPNSEKTHSVWPFLGVSWCSMALTLARLKEQRVVFRLQIAFHVFTITVFVTTFINISFLTAFLSTSQKKRQWPWTSLIFYSVTIKGIHFGSSMQHQSSWKRQNFVKTRIVSDWVSQVKEEINKLYHYLTLFTLKQSTICFDSHTHMTSIFFNWKKREKRNKKQRGKEKKNV